MPTDSLIPPSGFDRATGLDGLPGTPTPDGALEYKGANSDGTFFEEMEDSPQMEAGEQFTISHRFKCDLSTGQIQIAANPRGTILTDSVGNVSKVLTTSLQYQKGDYWILTITAELIYIVPPDEFSVDTIEFNPSIYLHPRYASVLSYKGNSTAGNPVTGAQIINLIQGASNFPQQGAQSEAQQQINSRLITDINVLALALELLSKVQKGFDTFYMSGFRVTWSTYSYLPQLMNPGGYIEDPVHSGNLPSFFWSDDQTPKGNNIFTDLAAVVSPILYGDGLSWLREGDRQNYERTWFKLTSSWIGGPSGHWDEQIYHPHAPPPALPASP